jgi:curved DNA-binding protein CbpA
MTAYEILSDSEARQIYDRHGEEGLKQHEARKAGGGHNPNDIFSRFFGGGGQQQEQRGPGMLTQLEVDLADMYTGRTLEVRIQAPSADNSRFWLKPARCGVNGSSRYPAKSSARTVTDLERTRTRTYINVGTVVDRESSFSGIRSSPGWSRTSRCRES